MTVAWAGFVALILVVALAIGMGQKASEDTVTLAIVAIVIVFGLVCALLAFFVHNQRIESQAWAARPSPPVSPALPQAQRPTIIVLPSPSQEWRQLHLQSPDTLQLGKVSGQRATALPGEVIEGASQESPALFYPRREG